jgi:hypothetical protein
MAPAPPAGTEPAFLEEHGERAAQRAAGHSQLAAQFTFRRDGFLPTVATQALADAVRGLLDEGKADRLGWVERELLFHDGWRSANCPNIEHSTSGIRASLAEICQPSSGHAACHAALARSNPPEVPGRARLRLEARTTAHQFLFAWKNRFGWFSVE